MDLRAGFTSYNSAKASGGVEILFSRNRFCLFRNTMKKDCKPDPCGHAQKNYAILTTVSICGANFLIVVSTPARKVI